MTEKLNEYPDYAKKNFDYFLSRPEDASKKNEYERRGLIPTNNLGLWLVDDPAPELAPNIRNPYDYTQEPFGDLIIEFRQTHPNLWREAQVAARVSQEAMKAFTDKLFNDRVNDPQLAAAVNEAYWVQAEANDGVFRILAPQMIARNLDPLDLCKR